MIFLAEPNLTGNERKYLNECIDTTFVSSVGAFVTRLEQGVADVVEAKYATAVSSGTAGLHMALRAWGVERGELVCIPSFTFIATANAVAHCGAEPWLIDVSETSWTMDPSVLEKELEEKTFSKNGQCYHKETGKRVAAIMPVYTLGLPAKMDRLKEIGEKYHLPLIADGAAAIGAKYKGGNIGKIADATVFSFNGNKTITCGGGGAIVSDNKELIERARHLATTARCGIDYEHDMVGYNNRMTNLQAAVGCAQLERVYEFVDKKRRIRNYYNSQLKDIKEVSLFPDEDWAESACWFSGVVLGKKYKVKDICTALKEKDIEARTFWKPVHLQKPYKEAERSNMPVSERIWEEILTLPSSTGIRDEELEYVVTTLKNILKG